MVFNSIDAFQRKSWFISQEMLVILRKGFHHKGWFSSQGIYLKGWFLTQLMLFIEIVGLYLKRCLLF